jgi:hypothetical protein
MKLCPILEDKAALQRHVDRMNTLVPFGSSTFNLKKQIQEDANKELLDAIDAAWAEKTLEHVQETAQAIQEAQDTGESHD